jgi:acetyl esterase/lipase
MKYSLGAIVLMFCGAGAAPAHAQTMLTGIQYGPLATQLLDVCIPEHGSNNLVAVAVFHGGGWRHGSRSSETPYCMAFASNNIVAFDIDYRLAEHTGNYWPVQLADSQLAIRWIRANAATYHVNTARVCAFGHSAGGQLALMLGVLSTTEADDMSNILPDISSQTACVVSISGPTDLTLLASMRGETGQSVRELVGPGSAEYVLAQETDASPALRIAGNAPNVAPIMLIHGTNDPLVPFAQAQEMSQDLCNTALTSFFLPNNGGHGEAGLPPLEVTLIQNTYIRFIRYNLE